jgi:Na+/H+ antiporter NhaC
MPNPTGSPRRPPCSRSARVLHGVLLPALLATLLLTSSSLSAQEVESPPKVYMGGLPFTLTVTGGTEAAPYELVTATGRVLSSGVLEPREETALSDLVVEGGPELPLTLRAGEEAIPLEAPFVPGWFSLVPPVVAILLALVFREVVVALFAGVWLGAMAMSGFNPFTAVARTVDTFVVPSLGDVDGGKTAIVVFSLLLGGMVGVIARNGGTQGVVGAVTPLATTPRRGKVATWLAGMAIFFDDYANTLIVGNTMRPITDRLRICREKLAYIVDSTAAPVAALVPISTWVGYEISLIAEGFALTAEQQASNPALAAQFTGVSPFAVFIHTIPYLFYPLLALAFVVLTSVMNRDLGPMARAEIRARSGGGLFRPGAMLAQDTSAAVMAPKEGVEPRWWNAALPVLTVVAVVLGGLYATGRASAGEGASLMDIFGDADPFATLLWGSLAGCLVAIGLSVAQRLLTLQEALDAWVGGMRSMLIAMVILVLAWSLGAVTQQVGTAQFLAALLEGNLPLQLLPVVVFVTAAAIAFSTGTSWGTMAILIPLVIPLTVTLGGGGNFDGGEHYSILLGSISSVLAGAIFGDHCSPISDTTVLSSMASGCDHIDHVRTQLPYALLVAAFSMSLGDIGTAFGLPNWLALALGVGALAMILRIFGTPTGEKEVPLPPDPGPAGAGARA